MKTVVATIGVFDGMHLGHQAVVSRARAAAVEHRARCVVYTFGTHPQVVLSQSGTPPLLTTKGEKVRLLAASGVEEIRLLQFNPAMQRKGPRQFLRDHVFRHYRLSRLVVGYDFAMGRERSGSFPVLRELGRNYGFAVDRVAPMTSEGPISSTRIREALLGGRVDAARALLGRAYSLEGVVGPGQGIGSRFGFPTANLLIAENKLRPGRGVYAVWARVGGETELRPAVLNIGIRPTVGGGRETVEAHLIGFKGGLVGTHLEMKLVARLRDERKFNNISELASQIEEDKVAGLRVLAEPVSEAS